MQTIDSGTSYILNASLQKLTDYKFKSYFIFITYLEGLSLNKLKQNPLCKIISDNVSLHVQRIKQLVLSATGTTWGSLTDVGKNIALTSCQARRKSCHVRLAAIHIAFNMFPDLIQAHLYISLQPFRVKPWLRSKRRHRVCKIQHSVRV